MTRKIIFLILFLVFAGFVYSQVFHKNISMLSPLADVVSKIQPPSPTPIPLVEMTIPYLRTRTYQSSLGELKKYTETNTYTSYTTSYTSDGLKVNGLLTIPKGEAKKYPAIVFVHGYIPSTQYVTTEKYVEYVDALARSGFVVFKIDLRGHGDSDGEAGGGYYSSDYVIDTLNARAALESSDFVLPDKIGLWGHSMAGNVVMRAFAAQPIIPAVVIWAGAGYTYQDLLEYRISDQSYRPPTLTANRTRTREKLRQSYGDFSATSSFWKQVAVTDYLGDLKGAIEIHHAVDDAVVSVEYSRNLTKLLDKTSVTHKLYEYPSGGHNITGTSFSAAMAQTIAFYTIHLK